MNKEIEAMDKAHATYQVKMARATNTPAGYVQDKMDPKTQAAYQCKIIRELTAMHKRVNFWRGLYPEMRDMNAAAKLNDLLRLAVEALANEVNGGNIFD